MKKHFDMSNVWPMPLYTKVRDGNTKNLLPHQCKSANSGDYNLCVRQTSLCHFIGTEQVQSVKILLKQGVAVNVTMLSPHYTGYTLLHYAVERSNAEIVELLLKNGAHVDASTVENRLKPLHIAVMRGNCEIIKYLLIYKAQIDATFDVAISKEYSCLHLAAQNNNLKVIELLLEFGANINLQDKEKRTPLHLAIQAAQVEAVNLLLKYHPNTTLKNSQQQTPLIFALDNMCPVLFLRLNNNEDLAKLRLQHQYTGCKCEIITHTLVRHLMKLKGANFKIDEKDQDIILLSETYRELERSCSNELEKMQTLVVKDMTIRYCDFLHMDLNKLYKLSKNINIIRLLNSGELEKNCPIYSDMIRFSLQIGIDKNNLIKQILMDNNFIPLPNDVVEIIVNYLSNVDLRVLLYTFSSLSKNYKI